MRGIEQQFLSLQKGFHELIPANLLRPFDERELELLIGGICKIDTTDWQSNTRLKVSNFSSLFIFFHLSLWIVIRSVYGSITLNQLCLSFVFFFPQHCTAETPVVQWFWQIVESYSEELRARLLQFVTGSSRVPLQGFKALQGTTFLVF
jgi:E3 ubiquitin ligase SMURF1/2